MYHVSLDLTQSQVKSLKQEALVADKSIKAYVTDLIVSNLERRLRSGKRSGDPASGGGSREKAPGKSKK